MKRTNQLMTWKREACGCVMSMLFTPAQMAASSKGALEQKYKPPRACVHGTGPMVVEWSEAPAES